MAGTSPAWDEGTKKAGGDVVFRDAFAGWLESLRRHLAA
jgi:hypothetical protein